MRAALILIFLFCTGMFVLTAQNLDSLFNTVQELEDSARLEAYNNFAANSSKWEEINYWKNKIAKENTGSDSNYWNGMYLHHMARTALYKGELTSSITSRLLAVKQFKKANRPDKVARQYNNIGNAFADLAKYDSSKQYYDKAVEISINEGDHFLIASSYINISTLYNFTGQKDKELEYLLKAIHIAREHKLDEALANGLFNLAVHYSYSMEFEKSQELIDELKLIYRKRGDEEGYALLHNLNAKLAFDQNDPEQAMVYLDSAMNIYLELGYLSKKASIQLNIGQVNAQIGKLEEARTSLWKAYETFWKIGDIRFAVIAMHDLSLVFHEQGQTNKALRYMERAVFLSDSIGVIYEDVEYLKEYSELYTKLGQYDSAYAKLLLYSQMQDSLNRKGRIDAISQMEAQFQTERKQLKIDNLKKEKELQDATLENQKAQNQLLYLGLGAALLMIVFISYAFVQKKRDNELIRSQKSLLVEKNEQLNEQKDIVEEKNREITDSINYARKIQDAVLPPLQSIHAKLPNSFVLYIPKDIVAGDFYWFSSQKEGSIIAAADCTGHGVPGAMVSVVCSNALNRAVGEFGLRKPSDILDKCQELVSADLGKSDSSIKDGMDISICSFNKGKVSYAGAHNPLWIIGEKPKTKSELLEFKLEKENSTLYELKADKQAIGNIEHAQKFSHHELELKKGSRLYLFSDGYLDQFGGDKGKKLKSKNLKEILLRIQHLNIDQQEAELRDQFVRWKGNLEQLDDVCIIGIEV